MSPPPRIADATLANLSEASSILKSGGLVAMPTETVYGLAADATSDRAVAEVFAVKERPRINPLIVHVSGVERAAALVRLDGRAERLARRFWPGPLTLVLPRRPRVAVSWLTSAGLDTLAVRAPRHPVAQALLRMCGLPLAAPSANRSGRLSPTTARHVADEFGDRVSLILDGGPSPIGIESTVLDLAADEPRLLRPGAVTAEEIAGEIGPISSLPPEDEGNGLRSPGRLASHYAPDLPLRLGARDVAADEALLAFGPTPPQGARASLNLSPSGDMIEAAANLFAHLRTLDRSGARAIAVMAIPDTGLGAAINDRLARAAAPRT